MYFSSVVAWKHVVSFYFPPIYFPGEDSISFILTMSKCLKGKNNVFNIKTTEQVNGKNQKRAEKNCACMKNLVI